MNGYYIVYLFDAEMKGVYLSLNQGWTQYNQRYGSKKGKEEIYNKSLIAQKILRSKQGFNFNRIKLNRPKHILTEGYELGNIMSIYYASDNSYCINFNRSNPCYFTS